MGRITRELPAEHGDRDRRSGRSPSRRPPGSPRADSCATRSSAPSRSCQYGTRKHIAEPVTESSGIPTAARTPSSRRRVPRRNGRGAVTAASASTAPGRGRVSVAVRRRLRAPSMKNGCGRRTGAIPIAASTLVRRPPVTNWRPGSQHTRPSSRHWRAARRSWSGTPASFAASGRPVSGACAARLACPQSGTSTSGVHRRRS